MGWTPAIGADALARRLGRPRAVDLLSKILTAADVPGILKPSYHDALVDIGNGHAERLMIDGTDRLAYWPRVWAARALAHVGGMSVGPSLLQATDDEHWRVRMTAIQTIGRLGIENATAKLVPALDDDHPRVRAAALLALERVGDGSALPRLSELLKSEPFDRRVERAISRIIDRR